MLKKSGHVIASFIISIIFIWGVGYQFKSTLLSFDLDPTLKKYIHTPHIVYKHRDEGWARTYKGKYGINAIEDITEDKRRKIIIWGDSYVEAHQVEDNEKMPQVLTAILEKSYDGLMAFGVGMSSDSVADYYFDIPKYEKLVDSVVGHFIIITLSEDILPDQKTDRIRGVFSSNPYRLELFEWKPRYQEIKKTLNRYGLNFIWEPVKSLVSGRPLRFVPAAGVKPEETRGAEEIYTDASRKEAWAFLFRRLREQTNLPIVLVYCPVMPKIENGNLILVDPDLKNVRLFANEALKNGIDFIDISSLFVDYYKKTGELPIGFANYRPGHGHFNIAGHRIVAEFIFEYIKRNMDI